MKQVVSPDTDWSHSLAKTFHALDDFAPPFDFFRSWLDDWWNILSKQENRFGFFVASFMHIGDPFCSISPILQSYPTGFKEMDGL